MYARISYGNVKKNMDDMLFVQAITLLWSSSDFSFSDLLLILPQCVCVFWPCFTTSMRAMPSWFYNLLCVCGCVCMPLASIYCDPQKLKDWLSAFMATTSGSSHSLIRNCCSPSCYLPTWASCSLLCCYCIFVRSSCSPTTVGCCIPTITHLLPNIRAFAL
jgi:hypothetical protein